jgi:hypothetical protein
MLCCLFCYDYLNILMLIFVSVFIQQELFWKFTFSVYLVSTGHDKPSCLILCRCQNPRHRRRCHLRLPPARPHPFPPHVYREALKQFKIVKIVKFFNCLNNTQLTGASAHFFLLLLQLFLGHLNQFLQSGNDFTLKPF